MEPINVKDFSGINEWYERFTLWTVTNEKVNDNNRIAYYLTMIGKDAYQLIKDLIYPNKPSDCKPNDLHKILTNHLKPQMNELAEITKFNTITREAKETYASFLLRIQQQAARCNFADQLKVQMRNRIVAGINDVEMQKKLLAEPKLSYDGAKTILNAAYSVEQASASVSF